MCDAPGMVDLTVFSFVHSFVSKTAVVVKAPPDDPSLAGGITESIPLKTRHAPATLGP